MEQDTIQNYSGIRAVDSLSANEFHVELNGEIVTGIFGVRGIHIRHVDLTAGKLVPQPLTVTKMVQQDAELPFNQWARETLAAHAADPRPRIYDLEAFAASRTHDAVWNAGQNQLVREGLMHNYLRMLWGKKILEWTHSPEEALDVMIELNNRFALDGRNPNSYSGIFWILGRYDRAWGPERPIFGKIRYMTSESTVRKLRIRGYLERYAAGES